MVNPENWPKYGIVNLKSVHVTGGEWVDIETIHGKGKIKMTPNEAYGILDHIWKDEQASWNVYVRVIPNGEGSTVLQTFFKPDQFSDAVFEDAMGKLHVEFDKLKEILEAVE